MCTMTEFTLYNDYIHNDWIRSTEWTYTRWLNPLMIVNSWWLKVHNYWIQCTQLLNSPYTMAIYTMTEFTLQNDHIYDDWIHPSLWIQLNVHNDWFRSIQWPYTRWHKVHNDWIQRAQLLNSLYTMTAFTLHHECILDDWIHSSLWIHDD